MTRHEPLPLHRGLFIGGEESAPAATPRYEVRSPDDGHLVGTAAVASADDVARAVHAAREGFARWAALPPGHREATLLRAADLLAAEGEATLLDLIIDESGSTVTKARGELRYAVDLLRTAAGEARRLYGDTFPNDKPHRLSFVLREPLGVVAVLSPFNAPLSLLVKMLAFPLAAGNAVVVKPSEHVPLTAAALFDVLQRAGVPAGAANLLTGPAPSLGAALVSHAGLDAVAFTGSTATGIRVAAQALQHLHRVQLELGGKNAIVVLDDVDVDAAAHQVLVGGVFHAGQICMANSRVIVHARIADRFIEALVARARALHLGSLRDPLTAYGPLINDAAVARVRRAIDDATAAGARLATGGEVVRGRVLTAAVLVDVPLMCAAWREELFGPVLSVVRATDDAHALALANDSAYGLSAAVLARDVGRALSLARGIRAGSVHVGMHAFQSDALAPIGGQRASGIGRSGGRYSTEEFTSLKWVSIELGSAQLPFEGRARAQAARREEAQGG